MLREKLGDEAFFRAMKHYLEANRLQNVVTADLAKAIEESTGTNVDRFFDQWAYGAGAPRFSVRSTYDSAGKTLHLEVKQTQEIEGHVGLFQVSIDVAITTASGEKIFPIEVSKSEETFSFPVDGAPLLVLFDKGDKILKSADFQKSPEEWIRQMQKASDVPDRADAAVALGNVKDSAIVVNALGEAARRDAYWGVREEALRALERIHSGPAQKQILAALNNEQPWVRQTAVEQLGRFSGDDEAIKRLRKIYKEDSAFTVRSAALESLALEGAPGVADLLRETLGTPSPDDILRQGALRAMGSLADATQVPLLVEWSSPGKPTRLRTIAISALGHVDTKNHEITARLISYLSEESFDIRFECIFALGRRGDPTAIEPLEALLKSGQLSFGYPHTLENLIDELKAKNTPQKDTTTSVPNNDEVSPGAGKSANSGAAANANQEVLDRLDRLEGQMTDINERLRRIEQSMTGGKSD